MPIFTAEQLDLSRLPPFNLVTVDEAAELATLKASIVARFEAAGVPFSVAMLRTDPAMILAEEFAFRKAQTLAALNDAGRRLSLPYTDGPYLDHIAATYFADLGLRRLPLVTNPRGTSLEYPADWESDARFALRISLAPEARSGSLGAYEFDALTAAPHLYEALALNHASGLVRPGQILVVLLGRDPDPNPLTAVPAQEEPAQIALATAALRDPKSKLGSDEVLVRPADRIRVTRSYGLGMRRGPDQGLVLAEARRQYAAYTDLRPATVSERRIGKLLDVAGEYRALKVSGVEVIRPRDGSGADVDPGITGVIQVAALDLIPEVIGG